MSKLNPEVGEYAKKRGEYFDKLSPGEIKSQDELLAFIEKTTNNLEAKQNQITTEGNSYDRQHTSFFVLAISFIVAGLLSSPPEPTSTMACRTFYTLSICTALIAVILLFAEYWFVTRHFDSWQKNIEEALNYVADDKWKNPADLEVWVNKHQTKVSKNSTRVIFYIEVALITLSIIFLVCWLIESLFNPNWPHISLTHNIVTNCL